MKIFVLSVLCLQGVWSYAVPDSTGAGAFSYQDSTGNRYGGTYRLRDGQVVETKGNFPPNFQFNAYQDLDNFFPEYFRNLGNLLQETFYANLENQKLAFNAAQKAFDLTSNQAGYIPNFNYRSPGFSNFPDYGSFPTDAFTFPTMPNLGNEFSAFAAAMASPGFSQQIAGINPSNPAIPNVNTVNQNTGSQTPNNTGGYISVSSSSYSSSSNVDGQVVNSRAAETVVDDNGKITKYTVHS